MDAETIGARFGERCFIVDDAFTTALQLVLASARPRAPRSSPTCWERA
jgi:hypothetical protein